MKFSTVVFGSIAALFLSSWGIVACSLGYGQRDAELIGQVKKVRHNTPLICPQYYSVDVSLGVMRNGTGSMSHEDVEMVITSPEQYAILKQANESGQLVKIQYDVRRLTVCIDDHIVRGVEVVK